MIATAVHVSLFFLPLSLPSFFISPSHIGGGGSSDGREGGAQVYWDVVWMRKTLLLRHEAPDCLIAIARQLNDHHGCAVS